MKRIYDIGDGKRTQWGTYAQAIDENFTELDEGKINNTDVVQETGESTTQVMSQAAVTKELTELENGTIYTTEEVSTRDIGVNLFNKKSVNNGYINKNGEIIEDSQEILYSNFIPVEENTTYTKNKSSDTIYVSFYDKNFKVIGTTNLDTFTTLENTKYVRVSLYKSEIDSFILLKGDSIPYKSNVPYTSEKNLLIKNNRNLVLKSDRFLNGYKNLLDPNGITNDMYISKTGETSFEGYCISNYIPIEEGKSITASVDGSNFFQMRWEQYDEELSVIYRSEPYSNTDAVASTTGIKGSCYARISFITKDLENIKAQIEYGEEATDYEPFPTYKILDERLERLENKVVEITDCESVNAYVKDIFLQGVSNEEQLYIKDFSYTNNYLSVKIYNGEGTLVSRIFINKKNIGGWWYIEPQNGSGIWGFMSTVDLSDMKLKGINAKINISLATDETRDIPSKLRVDFAERDNTIRKNICKPTSFYEKSIFGTIWGDSEHTFLDFEMTESSYFNTYKELIPLNKGESICVSYAQGMYQTQIILVNKYRVRLKPIVKATTETTYISITNDTEEDGYVAFCVRRNDNIIGLYPQVEYSVEPTDYQYYMDIPIRENDMPIILPRKIYLSQGEEANIYKKAIVLSNPTSNDIDVNTNGGNSSITTGYPNIISISTDNNNSNTIALYAKDKFKILSRAERTFEIVGKSVNAATILGLGDSFTDIANWIRALKEDLEEDGVPLTLIGMKNMTYKNESMTGGTLRNTFLESRGNAYLLSVNSFIETSNTKDGYGAVQYEDTEGNKYTFNGRWVDDTGNGYIRIAPISHTNSPRENSYLTKISGDGLETISYQQVKTVDLNPFWDLSNSSVSVKKYIEEIGYNIDGKFIIIIQFSFNDNGRVFNETTINDNIESYKEFISIIHDEYPEAYIIIGIEPASALIGGNPNYNNIENYQRVRLEFARAIFNEFDNENYQYIYINPGYAFVDTENGFDVQEVALSKRLPNVLTKSVEDGTHCNAAGMYQLGDSYRGIVRHILSL